jgi:uncharacterized protein with von Willebrand factor type A (vWA) domain
MEKKYVVEQSALNVDRFDERRFNELLELSSGLSKSVKSSSTVLSDSMQLVGDTWASFYKMAPSIDEGKSANHTGFIQELLQSEHYVTEHEATKMDDLLSALTTMNCVKDLVEKIKEDSDYQNYKQQQKDMLQKKKAVQNELNQVNQSLKSNQLQSAEQKQLKEERQRLLAEKKEVQQQVDDSKTQQSKHTEHLQQQMIQDVMQEAVKKAKSTKQQMGQLAGYQKGEMRPSLESVSIKEQFQLAEHLINNPKLKEIADLTGRFIQLAKQQQKRKSKQSIARRGVTMGNDLERVLNSELLNLRLQETKLDFLKRYAEAQTFMFDRVGKEKLGKGPIVICMDESLSMQNLLNESKAFMLALLTIAAKQRRDLAIIRFSSHAEPPIIFKKGRSSIEQLVFLCEAFLKQNTNFEEPLQAALDVMGSSQFKKADLLFVTDGEARLSEGFVKQLQKEKKRLDFLCKSILIGDGSTKTLDLFSDEIIQVKSLFEADKVFAI